VSRSYSIASAPEHDAVELTIERFEDGEVSPYSPTTSSPGDQFEVCGPIGGPFTWSVDDGGPLYLIGGAGMVPLMAMLRHRAAHPDAQITAHMAWLQPQRHRRHLQHRARDAPRASSSTSPRTYTRQVPDGWRAGPAAWTTRDQLQSALPREPIAELAV
jgi:ferredoxin-NADP reductase